jgi:hypothetical protein
MSDPLEPQRPDETFSEYLARTAKDVGVAAPTLPASEYQGLFTSSAPPPPQLHADDKAIIIAVGGSAFCAGLFGFYENHPVLGCIFLFGGLMAMAPISPFIRSRVRAFGRPALWAVALATWLFLAVDIGLKIWPIAKSDDDNSTQRILALEQEIRTLHSDFWDYLTNQEMQDTMTALKPIAHRTIIINCHIPQCRDLANSLRTAFSAVGWDAKFDSEVTLDSLGTGVYLMPNDDVAPKIAAALSAGAHLHVFVPPVNRELAAMQENVSRLVIGLKEVSPAQ